MRRKLAAGNWKMNGTAADLHQIDALAARHPVPSVDVLVCPPATLLARMAGAVADTAITVGGQDCHQEASGAHTGDISAQMLAAAGATFVILGHSERRTDHNESDALVAAKTAAALAAGLDPIVCVGESLEEREGGRTLEVIGRQLDGSVPDGVPAARLVVAYEPVWAIGTGRTPTIQQIEEVHRFLRKRLTERLDQQARSVRLLYGGSVKAGNAADIFAVPEVDGALVGGASLKAEEFSPIIAALEQAR
ncbi:triose-phosphate isomerase [Roseitranquillus sediminis]|uniref:triose-phosphate isomerase n=1 Tax=Roseitranquillus sediminis TaxID=2809051 RepID=UPI001D0C01F3|nr:triose-phosphate isomerase [Roseitranquillus sediminis]MBM9594131.1 triose-phosphate isomerase [Roseitranquillus sediminis]